MLILTVTNARVCCPVSWHTAPQLVRLMIYNILQTEVFCDA